MTNSETVIEEKGSFKRTYYRKGKKRKVKTDRLKRNPERVTLAKQGDLELYCYPYQYPDQVFIGLYPESYGFTKDQLGFLFRFYNIAKWYLEGEGFSEPKNRKGPNSRRRPIVLAYNLGLSKVKKLKKSPKKSNLIT